MLDKLLLLLPQVKHLFEYNQDLQDKYRKLETFHSLQMESNNQRIQKLESDLVECSLKIESDRLIMEGQDRRIERLKNDLSHRREPLEYEIGMPTIDTEELKKALKLADTFTLETIVQYIGNDTYEIVKNLAKVTNEGNAAAVIAYRDGALSRNDALMGTLKEAIKGKTYVDRLK